MSRHFVLAFCLVVLGSRIMIHADEFAGYSRAVAFRPQLIKMLDDDNVDARVRAAQALIMLSQPPKPFRLKSQTAKPQ